MRRRKALVVLCAYALGAAPVAAWAQQRARGRPYRIGSAINFVTAEERAATVDVLTQHGWNEGRDYIFVESGLPFGRDISTAAKRIVAAKPDVIVTVNTAYAIAVRRRTTTIPIVMWVSGYPVEAGLALSLNRPGGNVTGNTALAGTGLYGKMLELLREARPGLTRVGVLFDYVPPASPQEEVVPAMNDLHAAARTLGLSLTIATVDGPDRLPAALSEIDSGRPEGMFFTAGAVLYPARQEVLRFALERRLPTVADWADAPDEARLRPLLTYASPWAEFRRKTYDYVVRILRDGAKPGELPIQQPSSFELIASAKTAKAIGLTIPRSIMLRADHVIE